jgi:hypothetical protein
VSDSLISNTGNPPNIKTEFGDILNNDVPTLDALVGGDDCLDMSNDDPLSFDLPADPNYHLSPADVDAFIRSFTTFPNPFDQIPLNPSNFLEQFPPSFTTTATSTPQYDSTSYFPMDDPTTAWLCDTESCL